MKAVIRIEFFFSVFLFLGSIFFISLSIGKEVTTLENKIKSENLKSKSYELSEILLFDKGYPENWNEVNDTEIKRIGFSEGNYFLSEQKLQKLQNLCDTNYTFVNNLLTDHYINITVKNIDDDVLYKCEPKIETLIQPKFVTQRIGILNGELVKILITLIY